MEELCLYIQFNEFARNYLMFTINELNVFCFVYAEAMLDYKRLHTLKLFKVFSCFSLHGFSLGIKELWLLLCDYMKYSDIGI